jgi:hypothetical protein
MRSAPWRARIEPGDGNVVEEAEAHRPLAFGVVTAGTHLAEGVANARALVHDLVDGLEARADRAQGRLPASRRHDRIGVEMDVSGAGPRLPDGVDVAWRVGAGDVLLHVRAQRRLGALQSIEGLMRQHLVDGPHAVGPLGMAQTGIVPGEAGMSYEERRHVVTIRGWRSLPCD